MNEKLREKETIKTSIIGNVILVLFKASDSNYRIIINYDQEFSLS